MRAWSDRPFGPVTPLAEVAGGALVAGENGQCAEVRECAGRPDWLFKRYKPGFPVEPVEVLDRLVALPGTMKARDLALVDEATCWPVSRVVSGERTVGVLMAKAPPEFFVRVRTPFGPPETLPLALDHLVSADPEYFAARDWAEPDLAERTRVARNILRAGVLFERYGVVYGDWSYANLFWERGTGRVFVIDLDSCGFGSMPWVECNTWNDPAVETGQRLTVHTDRYKAAMAVLRCLTGVRGEDPRPAFAALPPGWRAGSFGKALLASVTDAPDLRPSCMELLELLDSQLDDESAPRHRPPRAAPRQAPPASVPPQEPVPRAAVPVPARHAPARRTPPGARSPERAAPPAPPAAPRRPAAGPPSAPPAAERLLLPLIIVCLLLCGALVIGGMAAYLFP